MQSPGFSIIELLVVLAILAILITIALPTYNNYTTKTHVYDIINILQQCRKEIDIAYQETGTIPGTAIGIARNNSSSATAFNNPYLDSVTYNNTGDLALSADDATVFCFANIKPALLASGSNSIYILGKYSTSLKKLLWTCGRSSTRNPWPDSFQQFLPPECNNHNVD